MASSAPARASTVLFAALASLMLAACVSVPATPGQGEVAKIQILAINDFHGNLEPPSAATYSDGGVERQEVLGGAARIAATLAMLREGHADTVTVAAGDLISASPLASAHFLDEPAIAALNRMHLDVASVGNHEFDRGIAELHRVQDGGCAKNTSREPCALEPYKGADFTYLAGNTVDADGASVLPGTALRKVGGITIGFIGLTTKDTASLVSPGATRGYRFLDEAPTANRLAAALRSQGAQVVVLLIHEGGYTKPPFNTAGCPELTGPIEPILERLDPSIQLVISGHTHNAYVCESRTTSGHDRLLTSAGRYGYFVTDLELSVDRKSGEVLSLTGRNVPVRRENGEDGAVAAIVSRYVDAAKPVAARKVGTLAMSEQPDDCVEPWHYDLVADAQLAAGGDPHKGGAEIAFINSGGVRTWLEPAADGTVTYGQIFAMQPFGNVVEVLELTGAQLRQVLEEQFCGEGVATICFSSLAPSAGFTYSFDRHRPAGDRVTALSLDGVPIVPGRTYRVAVNNFLANGGDGFRTFAEGRHIGEAGLDVDALEAYIANGKTVPRCGRVHGVNQN